ncbi:MAG: c-type cytochrome [Flavobacteriales bacterium]|nr:c-type cytochrome [Flavobacteriales bacterium]
MLNRILLTVFLLALVIFGCTNNTTTTAVSSDVTVVIEEVHTGPDLSTIPEGPEGDMIRYGRELVMNTAKLIGPDGSEGHYLGNKMNCTNCHLDGGLRPYGYNYFSTYGRYPQYRSRENAVLTIEQRVNNCVERPHNGSPIPLGSKEMVAFVSYIQWASQGVPIGEKVKGSETYALTFPARAADPVKGEKLYTQHCARCHGENGEGIWLSDSSTYEYPPLWGEYGYQPGSSMFRLIKAAQFIKANMPFDQASWEKPILTDQEAFDVAAYVNDPKHPRPSKKGADYNDISTKYVDYPFGPYDDPFSEKQHKYGPFQPIIDYRKEHGLYLSY